MRATTGADAARIWDRFAPRKNPRSQPPDRRQGQGLAQPDGARQDPRTGRVVPPANLIRGKR